MGGVLSKVRNSQRFGLRLRIVLREEVALGPGRADLLQRIRELGSIAAAGRSLGMSYKRAWTLVNSTSSEFGAPVVAAVAGGTSGGKAQLTDLGLEILELYRRVEVKAAEAVACELLQLQALAKSRQKVSEP